MARINVKPGVAGQYPVLTLVALDANAAPVSGNLVVPAAKDFKIGNAPKFYTWTQLDAIGEFSTPTTSTCSITTNIVVDDVAMFGNAAATSGSSIKSGIWGMTNDRVAVNATITVGTKTLSGTGYLGGTELTTTSDQTNWSSPLTININGGFTTT